MISNVLYAAILKQNEKRAPYKYPKKKTKTQQQQRKKKKQM